MTVIEKIVNLMHCEKVDGRTADHALLEETDTTAKLKKLTLSDLQTDMLVLKIDAGRKVVQGRSVVAVCMSPLFTTMGAGDHNCACDAVVVRERKAGVCEIVYIDLKSDDPSGFAGQFKSTRCFMRYVKELINDLYTQPNEEPMTIGRERFIVFHTDSRNARPSLGKQPTRFTPAAANSPNAPEKHIVLDGMMKRCTELF